MHRFILVSSSVYTNLGSQIISYNKCIYLFKIKNSKSDLLVLTKFEVGGISKIGNSYNFSISDYANLETL